MDIKQNEWIQIVSRQSSTKPTTTAIPPTTTENRFDVLTIEDPAAELERDSLPGCPDKANNNNDKPKRNYFKSSKTQGYQSKPQHPNQQRKTEKKTLVFGDSMVKNIDEKKIERAARGKTVGHSYSGATVSQLHQKLSEDNCHDNEYETIILHIGTNDLVREDADKVAEKMEELIEEVRHRAERVAVSSVIKRYDGRVPPSKIASYNYLMYHICLKHNIYYIDNDYMDKSLLNLSNLHLNKVGDKALGSAFCTFLKSNRASNTRPVPTTNGQPFFRLAGHRMKEWTNYLKHVSQVLRK